MKAPGAQNRRETADVFPAGRYYISPHPERTMTVLIALDKAKEKPKLSGWLTVREGVLKHR